MALDPEVKARWIADLRSGKYKQVSHALHTNDAFCCLGVLCVSVGATFEDFKDFNDVFLPTYANVPVLYAENLADHDEEKLSKPFMRRIGMSNEDQEVLVEMNDRGDSFIAIADYIEKHL